MATTWWDAAAAVRQALEDLRAQPDASDRLDIAARAFRDLEQYRATAREIRDQAIHDAKLQGIPVRELMDATGLAEGRIRQILAEVDAGTRTTPPRPIHRTDTAGWADRYQQGETLAAIAADTGRSIGVVRRRLETEGVELRHPPGPPDVNDTEWLTAAYTDAGMSVREIATICSTSTATVSRRLRAAGLTGDTEG